MAPRTTAMPAQRNWFDSYFKVTEAGSTIGTEVRGGLTNFLVMSYILVVNAVILSSAGLPFPAVVAATAIMAALFTGAMALWANYPYAGAAGLGINAVVAFGLVKGAGLPWQAAMGVVTLEGANPTKAFAEFGQGTDAFTTWFKKSVAEIHGMDLSAPPPGPMPEQIVDSQ